MKNGIKDGEFTQYYQSGKIYAKSTFENGKPEG